MKTLRQVKVGETVTVVKLHGEGAVKRRIMDMGITKGVQVYVRKVAPLGDPVEVTVRGYELSIRKNDAEMIEVAVNTQFLFAGGLAKLPSLKSGKRGMQNEHSNCPCGQPEQRQDDAVQRADRF